MSTRFRAAAGAAAALVLVLGGCSAEGDRRGVAYVPNMFESVPVDAGSAFPPGPHGQGLWLPPEGTVPMESTPFPYGPGPEEARRAGLELKSPLEPTDANLARGKQVFETICFVCHGLRGEGDGPIIGRFPNPPSLLAARARSLPDGQIFHIITRGQGIMPSHAVQVLPVDRWRAILHLRVLQGGTASPAAAPAAVAVAAAPAVAVAADTAPPAAAPTVTEGGGK